MAYDGDIALARMLSKTFRAEGLKVKRGFEDWNLSITSPDGGAVAIECKKNDSKGEDVYLWVPLGKKSAASASLKKEIRKLLTGAGLYVGI